MEGYPADSQVIRPREIQQQIQQAYRAQGCGYRPHTRHFAPDGTPRYTNRLILEDSPYLLQHAHNPVDWYPWGEEALAKAKREHKPIFLSVGYSTCHWCHVMEQECFKDIAIAQRLNEQFVSIKVDRERRPDLDAIYMSAVLLMNGQGGWPMSIFLTADGKPFFGGAYFPPERFLPLLARIAEVWRDRQDEVQARAQQITAAVSDINLRQGEAQALAPGMVEQAAHRILESLDPLLGGFGQAPKFPHEPWLFLLLDQAERRHDAAALKALDITLDAMARGGLYDQVGGGFHRYATDDDWRVPHFEKMLYNQAQLVRVYLLAWRLTGKEPYRRVVTQTLDFVLREMRDTNGAFYSASDADSEDREGAFFIWTPAQIRDALAPADADLALELYDLSEHGNFEGGNILHLPLSLEGYAERHGLRIEALRRRFDDLNATLWRARERREHPLRDDKIITAWNGMMISTLAQAADLLGSPPYGEAARQAAVTLWKHNRKGSGELWRDRFNGRSSIRALLEDYAYFAEGLLHLYDLSGDRAWLAQAGELADAAMDRFSDDQGGFYLSEAGDNPGALGRPHDDGADNALPSASSVMLHVLQMLWVRTGELRYKTRAGQLIGRFAAAIGGAPTAYAYLLTGLDDLHNDELGARQYAARGGIRIRGALEPKDGRESRLAIELDIPSGWHINAHRPLDDSLVPTRIDLGQHQGWTLAPVHYPAPIQQGLDARGKPLWVYTGRVRLEGRIVGTEQGLALPLPVSLQLQACGQGICLPPEHLILSIPMHQGGRQGDNGVDRAGIPST